MTLLQTLNVSVAQIETDLRRGKSVDDICTEWQEPRGNVVGVLRAMQARGENPTNGAVQAPKPTAVPSLPQLREQAREVVQPRPEFKARATNAVELLVRADGIDDRRVQAALGRARKAMTNLASLVTRYEEQSSTRARIAELEAELRALRGRGAKAGPSPRSSSSERKPLTDRQREVLAANREKNRGEFPCSKCGRICTTAAGRGSHERGCTGDAA